MKFFSKRITVGAGLTVLCIVAAIVYSVGYKIATDKFNKVVSYNQEKQKMYSKLNEIDYAIRQESIVELNEDEIVEGICSGYINGIKSAGFKYFKNSEEYQKYLYGQNIPEDSFAYDTIGEQVGYLRLKTLTNGTGQNFIDSIEVLKLENIQKIIIDLRDCSEGNIEEVSKILEYLLPKGDIISAIDSNEKKEIVCKATSNGVDVKLVVIANKKTSGAAELIVSALKDVEKAKIVGVQTSGNAVREKTFNLIDGAVVTFPDAHYVTQSGSVFFEQGIAPDLLIGLDEDTDALFENGELPYDQDSQFQSALNLINE